MRRWISIAASIGLLVLVVVGSGYYALKRPPSFYVRSLGVDPQVARRRSDEMLFRATSLRNEALREGQWQSTFTAEQINGWLAVDMVENHPGLLPDSFREPRLAIEPQRLTLAFRYNDGDLDAVLSVLVEAYLAEPNVIALKLEGARAGSLPMPLSQVVEYMSKALDQLDLKVQWQQSEGDPVALVTIPATLDEENRVLKLETLELRDGALFVAGRTEPLDPNRSPRRHAVLPMWRLGQLTPRAVQR